MSEKRYRMQRVNGALREVLSERIGRGLKDPRLGFVTVTAVEATSDLRHARVFVSILGDQTVRDESLSVLRSAEGVLQGAINDELHLKRTPALEFVYDESVDRGFRIDELLRAEGETIRSVDGPTSDGPAPGSQSGEAGAAEDGAEQ
jgi:ribosome-binding factor A